MNTLVREFHGHEQLVPAIDLVSQFDGDGPDAVVVRGLITDPEVLKAAQDDRERPAISRLLYERVPELSEADAFVAKRWQEIGYAGMSVKRGVQVDQLRTSGIAPHVDNAIYGEKLVEVIVQGSLCLSGTRRFLAERLPVAFFTEQRGFDLAGFEKYTDFRAPLFTSIFEGDRQPRSSVLLQPGDMALFAQHPAVVLHSVQHPNGSAKGRLLSWRAEQVKK